MPKVYNAPPGFEMNPAGMAKECRELRSVLAMVADIAHSGGAVWRDESSALIAIRRLTLDAWNPRGTLEEHKQRVMNAEHAAKTRKQRDYP